MENFISNIEAFNNTLVRESAKGIVYVDSLKELSNFTDGNYKLDLVYRATKEELIAAASGEGEMSKFSRDGITFFGNVYQVEKA